jgi:hypothetical protein
MILVTGPIMVYFDSWTGNSLTVRVGVGVGVSAPSPLRSLTFDVDPHHPATLGSRYMGKTLRVKSAQYRSCMEDGKIDERPTGGPRSLPLDLSRTEGIQILCSLVPLQFEHGHCPLHATGRPL